MIITQTYKNVKLVTFTFKKNRTAENSAVLYVINYLRNLRLRTIAGSFAFPEQIWKKQIILITSKATLNTI